MKSNIELIMELVDLKVTHEIDDSDVLDVFIELSDKKLISDVIDRLKQEIVEGII